MSRLAALITRRRVLTGLIVLSAVASLFFAMRSYGSFLLLRSAYQAGIPQVSNLRAWMTLDYVVTTYRVPLAELTSRLSLPQDFPRDESLKSIADRRGVSRFDFVREVQRAIGKSRASEPMAETTNDKSHDGFADHILAAVLSYGYPALAATLLLGALGFPVPTGLVTVLAGSLAALGHIQWTWTALIVLVASIGGDSFAYMIGRSVSENFLSRHGHWTGYSTRGRERIRALFRRWGGLTVVFSRTLVSHLSSLVSLFAGIARYKFSSFLVFSSFGRLVWTSAYLGLGYGIGNNIDAASDFMANLTGLLLALAAFAVSSAYRAGLFGRASE
jgi:membrane protein DedA with SNARE-associated domain